MKVGFRVLVVCAIVLAAAGEGFSVTLSVNASAPSSDLLTYYTVGYDNFGWPFRWVGDAGTDHIDVAQSFLVTGENDWSVDTITVKARGGGAGVPDQGFHVQLWDVSSPSDFTGDSLVNDQTGVFPSSGLTGGFWTFDLEDVYLSAGEYYAFVLGFESGPASDRSVTLINAYSATDFFPEGRMFGRTGTPLGWTTLGNASNRDFEFYIQGSVVPEPTSLLLLGLPAALVLVRKRRRS